MEHEDAGDEEQTHHQDRDGADLDTGTVVSVESPHSSAAGAASSHGRGGLAATSSPGLPLSHLNKEEMIFRCSYLSFDYAMQSWTWTLYQFSNAMLNIRISES